MQAVHCSVHDGRLAFGRDNTFHMSGVSLKAELTALDCGGIEVLHHLDPVHTCYVRRRKHLGPD